MKGIIPLPKMPERRAFPRWPVAFECQTIGKSGRSRGVISDFSENGAGVASGYVSEVGEQIVLEWTLGLEEAPLSVKCIVRNVTRTRIGLEFLDLSQADRLRIVNHFRALERARSST